MTTVWQSSPSLAGKRHLRYASTGMLSVPRTTTTLGMRSFAVAGPVIWNSLPAALRTATLSPLTFAQHLKSHLLGWSAARLRTIYDALYKSPHHHHHHIEYDKYSERVFHTAEHFIHLPKLPWQPLRHKDPTALDKWQLEHYAPESQAATSLWDAPSHLTSDTPQSNCATMSRSLISVSFVQLLKYDSSPVHRRCVRLEEPTINPPSAHHSPQWHHINHWRLGI